MPKGLPHFYLFAYTGSLSSFRTSIMTGAGPTSPSCMTRGRGTMLGIHKSSRSPSSERSHLRERSIPKAKLPPAYLNLPATSSLIDSCTRKYHDWTQERLVPEGGKRPAPKEHFVWLSKDYTPYDHDPESPFVPPDFTLGLPPIKDWSRRVGEPPWVLDPQGRPKPVRNIPVDSTSSMDEGKKRKKKKKKYCHSKKTTGNPELKVTTRGEGADTPVWAPAGSTKDSSSSSDSQSEGDSGLGSNPSFQPHRILIPSPGEAPLPSQVQTLPRSP